MVTGVVTLLHWLPALLWMGVIFYLSNQTNPPGGGLAPDYVGHFLVFGILTAAVVSGLTRTLSRPLTVTRAVYGWLLVTAYALFDEFHQSYTPGREPSLKDIAVDMGTGLIIVVCAYRLLGALRRQPPPSVGRAN